MIVISLIVLAISCWGAFWARVDGGGIMKCPNWLERLMCALPFIAYGILNFWWTSILCLATWFTMGMDPGTYFSSRQPGKLDSKPGFIDTFVSLFFGPDPRSLENYNGVDRPSIGRVRFGMATTGFIQTLGPALHALCISDWIAAGLFFLAGILRAAAYSFNNTEIAEPVNGFQRSFFAAINLIK